MTVRVAGCTVSAGCAEKRQSPVAHGTQAHGTRTSRVLLPVHACRRTGAAGASTRSGRLRLAALRVYGCNARRLAAWCRHRGVPLQGRLRRTSQRHTQP